jgi:hypothetical protein
MSQFIIGSVCMSQIITMEQILGSLFQSARALLWKFFVAMCCYGNLVVFTDIASGEQDKGRMICPLQEFF